MKKILFIIGAMLALAGCTKEELTMMPSDSLVSFTTETTITRATENKSSWSANDLIGIYATNNSGELQYTNVAYEASSSEGAISFSNATDAKIYYTSYSENTNFVAYYPHNEYNTDENVAIDLAEEDQDDLLVSEIVSQSQAAGGAVELSFSHALSLVQITVTAGEEISSLDELEVSIAGSYTKGSYNLLDKAFTIDSEQKDIKMDVATNSDGSVTVIALVMPYDYSSGDAITFSFKVDDRTFYKELTPDWDAAYKYSYTAKVGKDYLDFEAIAIEDWKDEDTGDVGSSIVDIYYNSSDNEYYINSAKGLAAFRDLVNGRSNTTSAVYWGFEKDIINGDEATGVAFGTSYLNIDGILTQDIDLSELCGADISTSWAPIGYSLEISPGNWEEQRYNGTFDGGGHEISGLYISISNSKRALFSYLDTDGEIYNLGVKGSVTGTTESGGIVAANYGFIINCYSLVDVTGTTNVGGIAGHNIGNVANCYNQGDISGTINVGGIVGYNDDGGYVGYCYSTGGIPTSGERIGGVVGYNLDAGYAYAPTVKGSFCLDNIYCSIGQASYNESSGYVDTNVCTSEYLSSSVFAVVINNGATTYNINEGDVHAVSPIPACAWVYNEGGYPKLDFDGVPAYVNPYDIIYNTTDDIYEIYTGLGLKAFAALVNGDSEPAGLAISSSTSTIADEYFVFNSADDDISGELMDNIDLSKVCGSSLGSWTPIGSSFNNMYAGNFDGGGYEVENLYISSSSSNQGLFGYISGATIKNLGVSGSVTGSDYVGGVVGRAESTSMIIGCYNNATVTASADNAYVGGIAGCVSGSTIVACYNSGSITGSNSSNEQTPRVGGIVGYSNGATVTSCYSYGTVSSALINCRGGVVGQNNSSTISYCYYDTSKASGISVVGQGSSTNSDGFDGSEEGAKATLLTNLQSSSYGSDYWQEDTNSDINSGYPILYWQVIND